MRGSAKRARAENRCVVRGSGVHEPKDRLLNAVLSLVRSTMASLRTQDEQRAMENSGHSGSRDPYRKKMVFRRKTFPAPRRFCGRLPSERFLRNPHPGFPPEGEGTMGCGYECNVLLSLKRRTTHPARCIGRRGRKRPGHWDLPPAVLRQRFPGARNGCRAQRPGSSPDCPLGSRCGAFCGS